LKKSIAVLILAILTMFVFASVADAAVRVSGYYKSNGTYVAPYYRSNSDGNFYNNWSTKGNINPYTGSIGTKTTPSYNYYTPSYRSYYTPSYNYYTPSYRSYYTPSYYSGYGW